MDWVIPRPPRVLAVAVVVVVKAGVLLDLPRSTNGEYRKIADQSEDKKERKYGQQLPTNQFKIIIKNNS